MNKISRVILLTGVLSPLSSYAEIQAIDDGALETVVGQSGLVIELSVGTGPASVFEAHGRWDNAGYTMDTFKWEVDIQAWDSTTNDISMGDPADASGTPVYGGVYARDSQVAGQVDVTVDAVGDSAAITAGIAGYDGANAALAGAGGIGITFTNSDLSFRVGDFGVYLAGVGQISSMGAMEVIGMNIDGLEVVLRGNGR